MKRRPKLGLEPLEAREVPANFWWVGDMGPLANYPTGQNWVISPTRPTSLAVRATVNPGPADHVFYDTDVSDISCNWGTTSATLAGLHLLNDYAGTVRLPNMTVGTYVHRAGSTDQGAGTTLTVTGQLDITGGVVNSGSGAGTLRLTGAAAVGVIDPPGNGPNALRLNNNITVDAGAKLDFAAGGVVSAYDTSVLVSGGATAAAASLELLVTALAAQGKVRVAGANSVFVFTGTTSSRALEVDGGTVFIAGNGKTTKFMPQAPQDKTSVLMARGALVIDNGATLDAGGSEVMITGGQLATRAVVQGNQPTATITTPKLTVIVETALVGIDISDTDYNATGDNKHYFGRLNITGDISWVSGAYRPVVDGTVNAKVESKLADVWSCGGEFYVVGTDGSAALIPEDINPPAGGYRVGREWVVLHSDDVMRLAPNGSYPVVPAGADDDWEFKGRNLDEDWSVARKTAE